MARLIATKFLDSDGLARKKVTLNFDRIAKLQTDYYGLKNEPCFRVEYFDEKDRYDKVIYIEANFKVS